MSNKVIAARAGTLAFDILANDFHRPLINGQANRDSIEDAIVAGILSGELIYRVDQEIVDLAISVINDLIANHGDANADVAKGT